MRSMTGFGRGEATQNEVQVTAEIRALNQRFLEFKFSLPRGWGEHESDLRKLIQGAVARGRIEVLIRRVGLKPRSGKLLVNDHLAKSYVAELRRLGKSLGLDGKLGLDVLLQRPEIFQIVEQDENTKSELKLASKALKSALGALDRERVREGTALETDLACHLKSINAALERITQLSAESRSAIMTGFEERMRELLQDQPVDEKRLYEEAANAAQRADISEELARLRAHLHGLAGLFQRPGAVGKEIEFLLQEINREVNTIGSKSQNAALSRVAVEIKSNLEKMREQVQNIE